MWKVRKVAPSYIIYCQETRCPYVKWDRNSSQYLNTLETGHICEKIHRGEKIHDFLIRIGVYDCQ